MNKRHSHQSTPQPETASIRKGYEDYSVQGYYEKFGDRYRNPQESAIQQVLQLAVSQWPLDFQQVLDLACGSGEVTLALQSLGCTNNIEGIDPYTYDAYWKRTGKQAETYTFEDIADGILQERHYSLIVCSFALHLLTPSRLPSVVYQLSLVADSLLILTPNKRPYLKSEWGWLYLDEIMCNRVRARLYERSYC